MGIRELPDYHHGLSRGDEELLSPHGLEGPVAQRGDRVGLPEVRHRPFRLQRTGHLYKHWPDCSSRDPEENLFPGTQMGDGAADRKRYWRDLALRRQYQFDSGRHPGLREIERQSDETASARV